MGFARLKSLLHLGVMFEIDLQDQNFFCCCFYYYCFQHPFLGKCWTKLAIAERCPVSFWGRVTEWVQAHQISGFSACQGNGFHHMYNGRKVISLRRVDETVNPYPGHRDTQCWEVNDSWFLPSGAAAFGAALPFPWFPTSYLSSCPSTPPLSTSFLLGKSIFCP